MFFRISSVFFSVADREPAHPPAILPIHPPSMPPRGNRNAAANPPVNVDNAPPIAVPITVPTTSPIASPFTRPVSPASSPVLFAAICSAFLISEAAPNAVTPSDNNPAVPPISLPTFLPLPAFFDVPTSGPPGEGIGSPLAAAIAAFAAVTTGNKAAVTAALIRPPTNNANMPPLNNAENAVLIKFTAAVPIGFFANPSKTATIFPNCCSNGDSNLFKFSLIIDPAACAFAAATAAVSIGPNPAASRRAVS